MWPKTDADVPSFKAGDTITVSYKIVEGNKERIQSFRGVVIQIKGSGKTKMFTIRKISGRRGCRAHLPPLLAPHREDRGQQGRCRTPCTYLLPARPDRQEGPHQGRSVSPARTNSPQRLQKNRTVLYGTVCFGTGMKKIRPGGILLQAGQGRAKRPLKIIPLRGCPC